MIKEIIQLWNNPIIKVFREEGLSEYSTWQRLLKEWGIPEDLMPFERIEKTTGYYTRLLLRKIYDPLYRRWKMGLPISNTYLIEGLGCTEREAILIQTKIVDNFK